MYQKYNLKIKNYLLYGIKALYIKDDDFYEHIKSGGALNNSYTELDSNGNRYEIIIISSIF